MAMKLLSSPSSLSHRLFFTSNGKWAKHSSRSVQILQWRPENPIFNPRIGVVKARVKVEQKSEVEIAGAEWGKVSAVLFDMDGVLCNSEVPSRKAGVDVFAEMGVEATVEDFAPFTGTGEANFLGGVAKVKGVKDFNTDAAKSRFFEIYLNKYAKPNSGIGFPGALELITQCKSKGLKVAVASSADRVKVDANLAAAGIPLSMFDAIVSADAFENLKPAPDIFLAASSILNVPTSECVVIEDALAGVQAAKAAEMRCIAMTTSVSEEALKNAGPSFIRSNIGSVSLDDILSGGSGGYNGKMKGSGQSPAAMLEERTENGPVLDVSSPNDEALAVEGLQGSRRDILRYGSLGIAVSCLLFTITNWKAMQYASPKAIWNLLFGVTTPSFNRNEGQSQSSRIQQFVKYIADLENSGATTTVPEFPQKLDWLNTTPLQFRRDLKGKVVLLDFWTYCCINCMHVLPDLEYLENKYKDMPFTVVGVHSAKFDNEKDLEAIRNAVLRYNISHPVVNDGDVMLWRELGVNSWLTFVIIGPTGKVIAQLAGEGRRKDLDDIVEAALVYYGGKNVLNSTPIPLSLEKYNDPRLVSSPLKFPGKLAIDGLNNRLFISDSNHSRIVVTDLDGNFIVQIGSSGVEGLNDGSFDDATFNRPQGLAYNAKKNLLYVAVTENHALREIDFVTEKVRTLAGNGTKGSDYEGGGKGTTQVLNSPWDVCFDPVNENVYIAMAGQHQIWEHNTLDGVTRAFSGNGYERNQNGSSSTTTSFAQPSGITLSRDFKEAFIADSESSSIRALDLNRGGSRLLVGGDPIVPENLFKVILLPKNRKKTMYTTTTPTTSPHLLPKNLTPESKPIFNFSQKTILHLLTTKCSTLQQIKEVHAVILKTGHFQDHYVSGTLVKCYANPHFSNLDFAMTVFDHVPNPNIFVYNIVIKSCLDNNDPFKALDVYCSLVVGNARPNKFTYPTLLKACSNAEAVKEMVQVHAHVIKLGFSGDGHVKSAGIQMYANSGKIMEARRMLDEDGECDVICFNAMLDGYLKCGDVRSARELFDNMVDRNVGSWNVMVSGLAKYGMVEEARELFNGMKEKDQISWSSMVDGYVKGGYHKEALEVFNVMQTEKIRPNRFVLSSVLAACANIGALDQGRWVHAFVRKNSVYVDAVLGTALLDMYAKCGRLDLAWDVFEKTKKKEVFTWNAMICGLAMHGRAEDAVGLFSKMQREKFRPNKITFVGVLNACAHAGIVDKGLRVLNSMSEVYGIEPDLEHYGCVVDMLGRVGKLAEAEEFIWSMPMEPNAAVWGALLGACRIHGNAELGEKVGNILLEIDPENSGRYALLSNIYAKAKRWDDVANVRKLMKERGVKTTTGTSMIDLGGVVHEFKMGDGSHPQITEINKMLMNMMERLETEGYKPNTSQVLFDIGEEEKENALKYHSEKFAIAFGLINTNQRTSIRVVNSLRMCEDCHGAIKLISRVYGREIIVRDRVRYHHFRDGACSCKDFW